MNFTFSSSEHGTCVVKLWATGRYGFSLPKKVDITTAAGVSCTCLYFNKKMSLKAEPGNRMIVRIAIGAFLAGAGRAGVPVEIDAENPDSTWTAVATSSLAPDGSFSVPVSMSAGTTYRIVVTPGQGYAPGMTTPQVAPG